MANVHIVLDETKRAKDCQKMVKTLAKNDGKLVKSTVMDLVEKAFINQLGKKAFLDLKNGS